MLAINLFLFFPSQVEYVFNKRNLEFSVHGKSNEVEFFIIFNYIL
jgi:hypothetical protein